MTIILLLHDFLDALASLDLKLSVSDLPFFKLYVIPVIPVIPVFPLSRSSLLRNVQDCDSLED